MSEVTKGSGDAAKPDRSLKALAPLVPYAWRYKGRIAAALVALTFAAAATLVVPLAVRRVIDFGFSKESVDLVNNYFAGMIAVVAVLALSSGSRYYLVMTLGERIVADLRSDVFGHLAKLDAAFYDTVKTGELVSRLTADTTQMKSAFGSSASVFLRNLFLFVGAIGLMVYTSPKLSAYVLIAIPVIVLPLFASGRSVRARSRLAQDTLAEASAFASENLGAVRTMQAFGAERATIARFAGAVESAYAAACKATFARAILTVVAIFLAFASVIVILWLGAQDVLAGRITGGLLSQFLLYAVLGASALGQLSEVWSEIVTAAGAAGRIAEILAIEPRIVAPANPLALAGADTRRDHFRCGRFHLSDADGRGRAARPVVRRAAGRDGGDRRAVGSRKIDRLPASDALLRPDRGPYPDRRGRYRARRSGRIAPQDRARAAGPDDFRRQRRRQYRLWAQPMRRAPPSSTPPSAPRRTNSSPQCRRATTRRSASAA